MKIVVTDGGTLNPGDLSWDRLNDFGNVTLYDKTEPDQFFDRICEAEIVLTNKAVIGAELFNRLDRLKYIGVTATGVNVVDIQLAREKGIVVTNVPGYSTDSVSQHVFGFILNFTNHIGSTSIGVNKGKWEEIGEWCYWDKPLIELAGKVLGIVGMGAIGQRVAELGSAFGMKVKYYSPSMKKVPYEACSLEELLADCDVVSLHCPLNEQTHEMINAQTLDMMKDTALLVNTGRGQLVNEKDLAEALNKGKIGGAALDVLSTEPPVSNPLIGAKNCVITPHQSWATREARQRLIDISIDNVRAFLEGESQNVVN